MSEVRLRSLCGVLIAIVFFNTASVLLAAPPTTRLTAVISKEYPHDRRAFTQGLVWDKGRVYESTGLYGQSSLRQVDFATGKIEQLLQHEEPVFAEGITVVGDSIYQLTWTNKVILQYDKENFALRRTWPWPREGWGLTYDGSSLIVSDGTATLYFLDSTTLAEKRQLTVRDQGRKIDRLNELEYINGAIYANIWKKCQIAVINPKDGVVTAWLDLSTICARMQGSDPEAVLNGIMYAPENGRLFVTGKFWPALFEIEIVLGPVYAIIATNRF